MKITALILGAVIMASSAAAQSSFGSSDVSNGDGVKAVDSFDLTGLTPDDQTPTGKFTTAAEVAPILAMTKDSWAAVREYEGNDLVYFQVFSWRCGLTAVKFAINDGPLEDLELPECHMKYKQPNALIDMEAMMTFRSYDLNTVKSIRVDILFDNLTADSVTLLRENILIP